MTDKETDKQIKDDNESKKTTTKDQKKDKQGPKSETLVT